MVLAGLKGEGCRHAIKFGAIVGEHRKHFGKTQVIANRAADGDAFATYVTTVSPGLMVALSRYS
jgi:hypothetical protein